MHLKAKGPRTVQKTLRVPVEIVEWLQKEAAKIEKLSVPGAMVQILEEAYRKAHPAVAA